METGRSILLYLYDFLSVGKALLSAESLGRTLALLGSQVHTHPGPAIVIRDDRGNWGRAQGTVIDTSIRATWRRLLDQKKGNWEKKTMEISKKPFQKRSNCQLGRSPKMGLPQPCIAPWAWCLPRHDVRGQPSLELIQIGRCYTKNPAPTPHEVLPTEGECDNTEALWQLRGGSPQTLCPILQVVTYPCLSSTLLSLLAFLAT